MHVQVGARQTGPKALNYWSVEANGNWHTRQHVSAAWQVPLGAARLHILGCDCPHFPTKEHPEAVLGDFKHDDPVRIFGLDQVAFVYGSRWKQRYFTRRGDDYYPLPAQWDVKKGRWLPYHVESGTDWWVPFYGPTNFDRPTGPTCDGCHSVNYNVETHQVTEWNVGCEKCHGPGSLHVEHPTRENIVNPERLDYVRGNDTCIQCHSQGRPITNPIGGK